MPKLTFFNKEKLLLFIEYINIGTFLSKNWLPTAVNKYLSSYVIAKHLLNIYIKLFYT